MTKKILSLLLVVAMLATLSVGMFTASAEDAAAGTAFADDWSKWTIDGAHNTQPNYGITDEGYNVFYNYTWKTSSFVYGDKQNLGDRFDFRFKVTSRGSWGGSESLSFVAQIGNLNVTIYSKGADYYAKADYNGAALFDSEKKFDCSGDADLKAKIEAALTNVAATNPSWYCQRVVDVKLSFDGGILIVSDAKTNTEYARCVVENYDFSNTTVALTVAANNQTCGAFCDISGTTWGGTSFNLPYTDEKLSDALSDAANWTATGAAVSTTSNGDVAISNQGANDWTAKYANAISFGDVFDIAFKVRMHDWPQNKTGDTQNLYLGDLRIAVTYTKDGAKDVVLKVYYKGAEVGASAESWVPSQDPTSDTAAQALAGGMAHYLVDVKVTFDNGNLSVKVDDNDKHNVNVTLTDYDFSAAALSVTAEVNKAYSRTAIYAITSSDSVRTYQYNNTPFGSLAADAIVVEGKGRNAGSVHGDKIGDALYMGISTADSTVVGALQRNGADVTVDRITLGEATDLGDNFDVRFTFGYRNAKYTDNALTFVLGDLKIDITPNTNSWVRDVTVYNGTTSLAQKGLGYDQDRDKNDASGNPIDADGKYKDLKNLVETANQNSENGWNGWYMANASCWITLDISYNNGTLVVKQVKYGTDEVIATVYEGAVSGVDFSNVAPKFEFWSNSAEKLVYHIHSWEASHKTVKTLEEVNPGMTESDFYTDWYEFDDNYSYRGNKATKTSEKKATAKVAAASATLSDSIAMNFKLVGDFDKYYSDIKAANSGNDVSVVKSGDNWVASVTGLGAKDMAKDVVINFTAVDKLSGQPVAFSQAISVADYAKGVYAMSTTSAADKTVIAYMLNYGAAAQTYFGVTDESVAPDATIAASLTLANAVTADNYAEQLTKVQEVLNSDALTWTGASLVLEDKISVKVYFTGNADGLTATVDGAAAAFTKGDGYVEIKLNPNQLEKTIVVTVGDAKLTYSAATYAYNKLGGSNENLKALVIAAVNYGRACAAK